MKIDFYNSAKMAGRRFVQNDSGAITVDWVVLTAAVVGLGVAAAASVRTGSGDLADDVSTSLSDSQVASLDCMGDNAGPEGFACYTGPTIVGAGMGWGYAWMGACVASPSGGVTCSPGGSEMTQSFTMSDGQVYYQITRSENGETTVRWTDSRGNPVDEPPPMA